MTMIKSLLLLLATLQLASAFVVVTPTRIVNKNKALSVGFVMETEDEARYILSRAKECAYGDTCSVDDCQILLNEMLHMQSGCVTGTLVGHDICEEQVLAADVVAHLRAKIKDHELEKRKRYAKTLV